MDAGLGEILQRYKDAAHAIAHPGYQSTTAVAAREDAAEDSNDDSVAATGELLRRQAANLLKMHSILIPEDDGNLQQTSLDTSLVRKRLDDLVSIAMSKFYSYRYDLLPQQWRHIYTDTVILLTYYDILSSLAKSSRLDGSTLDRIVEHLDKALITTGGAGTLGSQWIEKTLSLLDDVHLDQQSNEPKEKRQKVDQTATPDFRTEEAHSRPALDPHMECPRFEGWTLHKFEMYMNEAKDGPLPVVFTDLMQQWPALADHPWKSREYLLSKTFGGRRLVPVEVGRSYVDDGWGQELIQFKEFLRRYVDPAIEPKDDSPSTPTHSSQSPRQIGYLAQHNLFKQIPSLRNDIHVPDFCWADVPLHPLDPSKNHPPVSAPQLNAWFGPAGTITPLHTDNYHNLLCQVVGTKYVRLYPPSAPGDRLMWPRPPEGGIDMSNTSELDVGVLEGWDERPEGVTAEDVGEMKEGLKSIEYRECIIGPGDTLLIPIGWWHYVRSLSVSFSVSFWWN